jgi:hypothetical protein
MLIKACVIPLLYLDFEIRRDYIVANLCENRNRPMMNCNGKCYLAKKLAEARKQEEKQAESDFLAKLFSPAVDFSSLRTPEIKSTRLNFLLETPTLFAFQSAFRSSDIISDIFHPPLLA